jgi:hypothetical protein
VHHSQIYSSFATNRRTGEASMAARHVGHATGMPGGLFRWGLPFELAGLGARAEERAVERSSPAFEHKGEERAVESSTLRYSGRRERRRYPASCGIRCRWRAWLLERAVLWKKKKREPPSFLWAWHRMLSSVGQISKLGQVHQASKLQPTGVARPSAHHIKHPRPSLVTHHQLHFGPAHNSTEARSIFPRNPSTSYITSLSCYFASFSSLTLTRAATAAAAAPRLLSRRQDGTSLHLFLPFFLSPWFLPSVACRAVNA